MLHMITGYTKRRVAEATSYQIVYHAKRRVAEATSYQIVYHVETGTKNGKLQKYAKNR